MNKSIERVVCFRMFIYFLVVIGYVFSRGFYSDFGILFLLLSFILALYSVKNRDLVNIFNLVDSGSRIKLFFVLTVFLSFLLYGGLYQDNLKLVYLSKALLFIDFIVAVFLLFVRKTESYLAKTFFVFLYSSSFVEHVLMIISSPSPRIDVFEILKHGALSFMRGLNPYTQMYHQFDYSHIPDFYSYWPGVIYLTAPFVKFLADPRYLIIFCEFAASLMLYVFVKKSSFYGKGTAFFAKMLSLILLFNPMSLFILEESYIDSVIVAGLAFFVFLWLILKKRNLALFFLGLLMSTKQTVLIAPFFLFKSIDFKFYKKWFLFVVAILFSILPFCLWSVKDFISDTILIFIKYPARYDSLTMTSLFYKHAGVVIPIYLSLIIWILSLIFLVKNQKRGFANFFWFLSIWLLGFFIFNKYAFVEYYYLVSSLMLFSIGLTFMYKIDT